MPQDFSFDVVSEYDAQELTNAMDQARREVSTRFDFKGTDPQIDRRGDTLVLEASTEDRARAVYQVLVEKAARRGLARKLFQAEDPKTVGRGRGQIETARRYYAASGIWFDQDGEHKGTAEEAAAALRAAPTPHDAD